MRTWEVFDDVKRKPVRCVVNLCSRYEGERWGHSDSRPYVFGVRSWHLYVERKPGDVFDVVELFGR